MKLYVATHNQHKLREIGQILPGFEIVADDPTGLEGREVVLGYATANMNFKSGDTSNPFMPKFPKRNKNKGTAPEVKKQ